MFEPLQAKKFDPVCDQRTVGVAREEKIFRHCEMGKEPIILRHIADVSQGRIAARQVLPIEHHHRQIAARSMPAIMRRLSDFPEPEAPRMARRRACGAHAISRSKLPRRFFRRTRKSPSRRGGSVATALTIGTDVSGSAATGAPPRPDRGRSAVALNPMTASATTTRQFLCVQNTIFEPGWRGYPTIELTNHTAHGIHVLVGMPIAQLIFELVDEPVERGYSPPRRSIASQSGAYRRAEKTARSKDAAVRAKLFKP